MSVKKGVLRKFAKFIGKHLRQSLFFLFFNKKETDNDFKNSEYDTDDSIIFLQMILQ